MSEKVKDVLAFIGLEETEVTALMEGKDDADVDAMKAKAKGHFANLLPNDSDFINPIREQNKAKTLAEVENKIRSVFGLGDDVKGKKLDDVLKMALSKAANNSAAEQLQNDLLAAREQIARFENETLPKAQQQAQEQIRNYAKRAALTRSIAAHALIIGADDATELMLNKLPSKYIVDIDETNNITITTKDGLKPTANNKVLTAAEVIAAELEAAGLIKKNNGGDPPTPPAPTPTPAGAKKFNISDKAYQNLDAVTKIRKA